MVEFPERQLLQIPNGSFLTFNVVSVGVLLVFLLSWSVSEGVQVPYVECVRGTCLYKSGSSEQSSDRNSHSFCLFFNCYQVSRSGAGHRFLFPAGLNDTPS